MDSHNLRIGRAQASIHHGEILQGAFEDRGRIRRGLVTLPSRVYSASATFTSQASSDVTVTPAWKIKALRAATLTIAELRTAGLEAPGGHLHLSDDVPVCKGFGSSTSDVVASILAVRQAYAAVLPDAAVARLAVQSEVAADPLMFDDRCILFAHHEGEVIEDFGGYLPALTVIGFDNQPAGPGVQTLALPPVRYTPEEIATFGVLRSKLRRAIEFQDAAAVGAVATASSKINQRHLPVRNLDRIHALASDVGAVGVQVAHSGVIAGLLFDSACHDVNERTENASKALQTVDIFETWRFETAK